MSVRAFRRRKWLAFVVSLIALCAATWTPAQVLPGGSGPVSSSGGVSFPVSDEVFKVCDDGDNTKCLQVDLDLLTTANTVALPLSGTSAAPTYRFGTGSQLLVGSGTVGSPSVLLQADADGTGTGFYRVSADNLGMASNGALVATVVPGGLQVSVKFSAGDGTTKTVDAATTFAATSSYHILACTGAETINTVTGGVLGMQLVLLSNDTDCTIADDDTPTAANAVNLTGTATNDVGAAGKHLTFIHDGNAWQQTAESANN